MITPTLDTPLEAIDYDDADSIGDDLIDTRKVGYDWGLAWDSVLRAGGTVRTLRDALLEQHPESPDSLFGEGA